MVAEGTGRAKGKKKEKASSTKWALKILYRTRKLLGGKKNATKGKPSLQNKLRIENGWSIL